MKGLFLSLFVFVPVLCHSQGNSVSIPFDIVRTPSNIARIILDYEMKGIKMKLFYDTGITGNLLSYEKAAEMGLGFSRTPRYFETLGGGLIIQRRADNVHVDRVFGRFDTASPTDSLSAYLGLPTTTKVDGWVGYTPVQDKMCLEIDFLQKRLSFIDTLPRFYIDNPEVWVVPLVSQDQFHETNFSRFLANTNLCMAGTLKLVDSIELRTNFVLDSGSPEYVAISAFDSLLFNQLLKYKVEITTTHGDKHPTVGLEIPELSIDTLMTNVRLYPYFEKEVHLYRSGFGTALMGGYLGIEFFLRYDKILFDRKNRMVYFYKNKE